MRTNRPSRSVAAADAHRAVTVHALALADPAPQVAVRVAHALRTEAADRRRLRAAVLLTRIDGGGDVGLYGPGTGAVARPANRRAARPGISNRLADRVQRRH